MRLIVIFLLLFNSVFCLNENLLRESSASRVKIKRVVNDKELLELVNVINLIDKNYVKTYDEKNGVTLKKVKYGVIKGIIKKLNDRYSYFLNSKDFTNFEEKYYVNIKQHGINYRLDKNGYMNILTPNKDIINAKILPNNYIKSINDTDLKNISRDEIDKILIENIGKKLKLVGFENGKEKIYNLLVSDNNEIIKTNKNSIYLRLKNVDDKTISKISLLLKEKKRLVFDLRDNNFLDMDEAKNILKVISDEDLNYVVKNKKSDKNVIIKGVGDDYRIILLINKGTYDGAELIAMAIKNKSKGLLIGEKTIGATRIIKNFKIDNKYGFRLTVGKISGLEKGIIPDIILDENYHDLSKLALEIIENIN